MANKRKFKTWALQRELVTMTAEIAIGATGAPTLNTSGSPGFASVARAAAGDYNVVMSDPYNEIVWFDAKVLDPASEDIVCQLAVRDADAAAGGTFSFFCNTGATATEVSDGATLQLLVIFRNVKALGA